jgi:hypothetical protein
METTDSDSKRLGGWWIQASGRALRVQIHGVMLMDCEFSERMILSRMNLSSEEIYSSYL